jgi:hypothetical protein
MVWRKFKKKTDKFCPSANAVRTVRTVSRRESVAVDVFHMESLPFCFI